MRVTDGLPARTNTAATAVAVAVCLAAATGQGCLAADAPIDLPRERTGVRFALPSIPLPATGLPANGLRFVDVVADSRADDVLRVPAYRGSRFLHEHLLPELTDRFRPLSTRSPLGVLGLGARDSNASRELTDLLERDTSKATERAVTDWLLAITDLEARALSWVAGTRSRLGLDRERAADRSSRRRPGVAVGLSHGLPRTDLKWAVGNGTTLRLSLSAYGATAIEFQRRGSREHYWAAGWDGENDRYRLQYRVSF